MTGSPSAGLARAISAYYAATAVFMLFDYALGLNFRVAFLEGSAALRALYYLFCFICLGLVTWRPRWAVWVSTTESLIVLSTLIITTALRILVVSDEMIEDGRGFVSVGEILNFLISGSVVYVSYWRGLRDLQWRSGSI